MILCITLNPVVDTTMFVDSLSSGQYRTEASRVGYLAGGKATNVARALKQLGTSAHLLIALGGAMGKVAATLLEREQLPTSVAWVSGQTRLQITLVDPGYEQRSFFAPNTPFSARDAGQVLQTYRELLPQATWVCISGSSPHAEADHLFPKILETAQRQNIPTLLDSSGGSLRLGLEAAPTIVKINQAEAEWLVGFSLDTFQARQDALDRLRQKGCQWAILTLGAEGALLACPEGLFFARPPAVQAINPISCGDAMTAGLLVGLDGGKSPAECLRLGTAVAAANALTWDACDLTPEVIQQYLPRVEVVRLADSPPSSGSLEA